MFARSIHKLKITDKQGDIANNMVLYTYLEIHIKFIIYYLFMIY